jgi:hypothetical protein
VEGAVLLTADNRVQLVPNTAGNWNRLFEAFMVPVSEQNADAGDDINTDRRPVVLEFDKMLFL